MLNTVSASWAAFGKSETSVTNLGKDSMNACKWLEKFVFDTQKHHNRYPLPKWRNKRWQIF